MRKILPININPYIRSYTHHGYHHAVISTHEKVSKNLNDDVACVKIKRLSEYSWENQVEGLQYNIGENDTIMFYGNKWNIDMNAAFWRKCNLIDEIEMCIDNQLYTHIWGSIYLFLSSNTEYSMTNFDNAYNLVFGNFCKDGIYYKGNNPLYTILLPAPIFPLKIKLTKTETQIILTYEEAVQQENKLILNINDFSGSNERIGFGINLRCNSYYEWLFSNYINIYVNLNNAMHIDFLCDNHKNWNCHTYNPFIDFNIETEKDIQNMGYSLINYIKKMIDLNRYVEMMINDNIHLNKENDFFHPDLIYGYDDSEECFHLLCYNTGKVFPITMTYADFFSERNYLQNRIIYVYNYNPAYEHDRISPLHILQVYKEYIKSQNISFYEPYFNDDYIFGINGITSLLSNKGQEILLTDIRVSHLLYERSICNHDRVEYLYNKNILNDIDYNKIQEITHKACKLTLIIRNLIIKKKYGGKTNQDTIINYYKEYVAIERELTDNIIQAIEKYLN